MRLNIPMTSHAFSSMPVHRPRVLLWSNKISKSILCKSSEELRAWLSRRPMGRDAQSPPLEGTSARIHRLHTRAANGWALYVHYERPRTRTPDGFAQRESATGNEHCRLDNFF